MPTDFPLEPTTQEIVRKMVDHMAETLDEDGDIHEYARQATIHQLGDACGPEDGLYWTTYNQMLVRAHLELALRLQEGRY